MYFIQSGFPSWFFMSTIPDLKNPSPKVFSHIIHLRTFFNIVDYHALSCQFCNFFKNIHIAFFCYFYIQQFPQSFSLCTSLTESFATYAPFFHAFSSYKF
ncbi:Os11g0555866 [Oryza sativa Japonica Group]|uniref:Os11g0555866 protein n=1 Tax=Oryza sativa subsp. japonica TaxID=39947 RepID=A0A0P0Y3A7_ORYSJ|nr:hypothetical protein EE612_056123 [Oryza sativa]BAT14444.1 Os11g0555866 [Oryza sativa Japonica Group]